MAPLTPAAAPGGPYTVPPEPSRLPSVLMALAMHAGLLLFLWAGINWQNVAPTDTEAEIWDMKVQAAAPVAPPREAPPVRETPAPPPKPVEKTIPKPVEPPPVEKPPVAKPDIALEREKKLKEEKRKQEQQLEKQRELEQARKELAEEKKLLEKKKLVEQKKLDDLKKAELKKLEQQKQIAEQKADKLAEEKAAEKAEKLAQEKAAKAEKAAKDKKLAEETKKLDKLRADEMRRITGGAGGTGEAEKSSAPRSDAGYIASITTKIKNTEGGGYVDSKAYSGNPRAVFRIEQLPSGEIISAKLVKSSGVSAFDDAVEKRIIKSSPLPKKKDGTVVRSLEIGFAMKEMN